MRSLRARAARLITRTLIRPRLNPSRSPDEQRRFLLGVARLQRKLSKVSSADARFGGIRGALHTPAGANGQRHVLFLHGGGFCLGAPPTYQVAAAYLARACGCPLFYADYRLAPEDPYPAALDDAERAYKGLLDSGFEPGRIAVIGDSAGANLALALAFRLRDQGAPLPASLALICPLTDLTLSGESVRRNRHAEPLISREWLEMTAGYYAADTPRDDPMLSPLFGDFAGLPPMLIQAGGDDLLLDDARRLQKAAEGAGVSARIEVFADLWHDFQMMPDLIPEGARALTHIGGYVKAHFED